MSASPPAVPANAKAKFKLVRLYWIGMILFAATCGPQILYGAAFQSNLIDQPTHARVSAWIFALAALGFFPSMICMGAGLVMSIHRHSKQRKGSTAPLLNPSGPPRFKMSGVFWAGLIAFLGCSGPLLVVMLGARLGLTTEPNPNHVLLALMATLTFWPSIGCMIGGAAMSIINHLKAKKRYANAE